MTTPLPAMTPDRWRAVDVILQGALTLSPDARDSFVRDACDGDEALRREVASLLAAHEQADDRFLEQPAVAALVPDAFDPTRALSQALAGRYAIEREVARGGMATVYLARDLRHGRRVALKVMRDAVAASVGPERFLEEIRVTAGLQHPHILPLFDSGSVNGLLWYAMPFVEGETLRERLQREGRLPVHEAVRLAREVADALDHAHARGVVHRDIKPENVLLQDGHALVADFGIALALDHAGDRLTRTGLTLGTPQYMAPEQASGDRAVDARVDVYALGAVLHEMLTGAPPFAGGTRQAVAQRMMQESPPRLAALRPEIAPALDAAVQRALAKRPMLRFPTAGAFAAALDEPRLEADAEPRLAPVAAPARRAVGRATAYVAIAAFALGTLTGWGLAHGWALPLLAFAERWTSESPAPAPEPATIGRQAAGGGLSLAVVDRSGQVVRTIAADRPWTPRFSPDGRRVAYGAFGNGRRSSDLWVTDLASGATQRVTDGEGDANDPQWSADGSRLAYSVRAPRGKDVAVRRLRGDTLPHVVAARPGVQFPSDWLRDGSALLVTEDAGAAGRGYDILVQPADGSPARPFAATRANETGARISPDGHWVAYTSDESGRLEVYLDSYPTPGQRVQLSTDGGMYPVWRGDGRELYYWRDGALVARPLGRPDGSAPPAAGSETVLFRMPYLANVNTMYDVSPDGSRFVIVRGG